MNTKQYFYRANGLGGAIFTYNYEDDYCAIHAINTLTEELEKHFGVGNVRIKSFNLL